MGCVTSSESATSEAGYSSVKAGKGNKPVKWISGGVKWTSPVPITAAELFKQREEFWETQPSYGGDRGAWDLGVGRTHAIDKISPGLSPSGVVLLPVLLNVGFSN